MSQKNGQDQDPMSIRDLILIAGVILIPSWTTAYITESVVYVIPMLAVCNFVVAQLFSHRWQKERRERGEMQNNRKTICLTLTIQEIIEVHEKCIKGDTEDYGTRWT